MAAFNANCLIWNVWTRPEIEIRPSLGWTFRPWTRRLVRSEIWASTCLAISMGETASASFIDSFLSRAENGEGICASRFLQSSCHGFDRMVFCGAWWAAHQRTCKSTSVDDRVADMVVGNQPRKRHSVGFRPSDVSNPQEFRGDEEGLRKNRDERIVGAAIASA